MSTILHRIPRRSLVIAVVAILILVVPIAVVGANRLNIADRVLEGEPKAHPVEMSQTVDGVTLTLDSVFATSTRTEINFTLNLPDEIAESETVDPLLPLTLDDRLETTNLTSTDDGAYVSAEAHRPGDALHELTLHHGPVSDRSQPVTVQVNELAFFTSNEALTVTGPWEFTIPTAMVAVDDPLGDLIVNEQRESGGVQLTLESLENRTDGLQVHYSITSNRDQPVTLAQPIARLVFADGSIAHPVDVQSDGLDGMSVSPGATVQMTEIFEQVDQAGVAAEVLFKPFLTNTNQSVSITINDPFGDWTSEPVTINGEQLAATDVAFEEEQGLLSVEVSNLDGVDQGTVMFLGVGAVEGIVVTDGIGNEYPYLTASTGLTQEGRAFGPGASTFAFDQVPPGEVDELTIAVPYSSVLIRDDWSFDVMIP